MNKLIIQKLFTCIVLFFATFHSYSQQWNGSQTNVNQISRYGNISIIPTANNLPYIDISNSKINLRKYNVSYPNFPENVLEISKDSIYFSYLAPGGGSTAKIKHGSFNFYDSKASKYCKFENGVLHTTGDFIANGKIGINTVNPSSRLQINAEGDHTFIEGHTDGTKMHGIQIWGIDQAMLMGVNTTNRISYIQSIDVWSYPSNLTLNPRGGIVTIGTVQKPTSGGFALAVGGGIICENVSVKLRSAWPDYVFEPNYSLFSIYELEKFILDNKHLPNVPSAAEVTEKGIDVAETNALLLQKIEELTLYIIDLQKQVDATNAELSKLK